MMKANEGYYIDSIEVYMNDVNISETSVIEEQVQINEVIGPVEIRVNTRMKYFDMDEKLMRISGKSRYETSLKIADQLKEVNGIEAFETVIIANGSTFSDAMSGTYLASLCEAPILMYNRHNSKMLIEYIQENLAPNGKIFILGGKGAVGSEIEELDGYKIQRISGKDRYETNLEVLNETGISSEELLICTGENFADSLSASALGMPIMLVADELSESQKDYIQSLCLKKCYIIGGNGAVNEQIEKELSQYTEVERISGPTRYETSVAVAERFFENSYSAVLVYGMNFPDGLCGGPLAQSVLAPIILASTGNESVAQHYISSFAINGAVLGGSSLIIDESACRVFAMESCKINVK